jgi:hypothetical protein
LPSLRHKRGTRAQIDAAATASALKQGEIYLITDEARLTVGTATNAHTAMAKQGEGGAGGAVGEHAPGPGLLAGAYISAATNSIALATAPSAAGRLDFYPFIPFTARTIDQLSIEVTTLIAASQARVGIYSSTAGNLPNALLTGAGSLLDCATAGSKVSPVSPSLALTVGTVYWLAVHTSATQTLRGIPLSALMSLGYPVTGATAFSCRRATATFALGLPVTAPTTTLTSAIVPVIKLRLV